MQTVFGSAWLCCNMSVSYFQARFFFLTPTFLSTFELRCSSALKMRVALLTGGAQLSNTHSGTKKLWSLWGMVLLILWEFPHVLVNPPPTSKERRKKKILHFFLLNFPKLHKRDALWPHSLFLPPLLYSLRPLVLQPHWILLLFAALRSFHSRGHQECSVGLLEGHSVTHQTAPSCTFITCSLCFIQMLEGNELPGTKRLPFSDSLLSKGPVQCKRGRDKEENNSWGSQWGEKQYRPTLSEN